MISLSSRSTVSALTASAVLAVGFAPAVAQAQLKAISIQPLAPAPVSAQEPPVEEPPPAGDGEIPEGAMVAMITPPGGALPPAEVAALKAQYESLSEPEQAEMRAYYADMGIDLDALLGLAAARAAQANKGMQITAAMRELGFARLPQAVLAARAKLGFGQVPHPNPETAPAGDIAKWIHLHVMAGEWPALASYLKARPPVEAEAIYAFIMQSMNRGDPGLLPEEVLAFAEASPTDFKPWQVIALGTMLSTSAKKYSTGSMLAQIRSGTRFFGSEDAEKRRRTVEFLAGGGLVLDAYDYLPPLDEARAGGDGEVLLIHGRYKQDLAAKALEGPDADGYRMAAWDLFCETTLLPRASFETRREALRLAIAMMNRVPRAQVHPWLSQVFASESLGPVALEIMALTAVSIGDSKLDVEQRAQAIVTLKEAVDILLARTEIDSSTLRVPLRMLTTALVTEMENTAANKGQQRVVAREAQLLLRAVPTNPWLRALEPSLATRASKASIAIATLADETDMALAILADAAKRSPADASGVADHFLQCWEQRLNPKQDDEDQMFAFYFFYREYIPMAPLTRGRQRRNLDRLDHLIDILSEIGVEPRRLPSVVSTFKACHARTEVYDRADIVRVFGDMPAIPASTAAGLAQTMGASLNGDWRSRTVQRSTGAKRSDSEIALLVDKGYGIALELLDSAISTEPQSWKFAVLRAALTYDRMQFKQSQGKIEEPEKQNEYRKAAFDAFAQAAERYGKALEGGQERDDPSIYRRWFGAAMGTAELNFLRPDDLPKEGSLQDDQIDRIRLSMHALPAEAMDRHIAVFAREVQAAVERAEPEVKPRLVKHALRIIGEHVAGASLRAMDELYRDLVKEEIKLRIALDGEDRVGVNKPFGVLISLRFTNSVDRETGGFSKYLQNGIWGRRGTGYGEINHRDELQKNIESTFGKQFTVDTVGFFDPFMPARGVVEEGQDGWLEKPMAYVILTRKDPSIDRLPQLVVDMQFTDQTGAVTLALPSNTPLLTPNDHRAERPVQELAVAQIVDVRNVTANEDDKTIKLEVQLRGKGVLPEVADVLAGLENPIRGYKIAADGVESNPPIVLQEGDVATGRFGWGTPDEPKDGYPEPDASGMYRLKVERTFTITYTPTGASIGRAFAIPTLKPGLPASIESRYYSDLDIVPVVGSTVAVSPSIWSPLRLALVALALVVIAGAAFILYLRRQFQPVVAVPVLAPARMTPLGVVTSLRRFHDQHAASLDPANKQALLNEISEIELKYFGPRATEHHNGDLHAVIDRWSRTLQSVARGDSRRG